MSIYMYIFLKISHFFSDLFKHIPNPNPYPSWYKMFASLNESIMEGYSFIYSYSQYFRKYRVTRHVHLHVYYILLKIPHFFSDLLKPNPNPTLMLAGPKMIASKNQFLYGILLFFRIILHRVTGHVSFKGIWTCLVLM